MNPAIRLSKAAVAFAVVHAVCMAADNPTVTIMTRNVDAGTDLGYLIAASDQDSFIQGMDATLAQLKMSKFQQRAAHLADEIATTLPDLVALQEVTLWRTGPIMRPPAIDIFYDQLDLILSELNKHNLHYGIIAVQSEIDVEAPVPSAGIDLRMTDRDVILARLDLPQSQFDLFNAQTHRYRAAFAMDSPLLGRVPVPNGWVSVDVVANGSMFRFVNTHLHAEIPGVPASAQVHRDQAGEILAAIANAGLPVVLAGDFNANAEPGPEQTGTVERIVSAGFTEVWAFAHPGDPGYTWPLFGEDQSSGPAVPSERIDLIFIGGMPLRYGGSPAILSAVRTGARAPFASDHAGVVVKLRLK
jgi:endonuclease/exonuclease/phosphatase family metal-dependent hydrolase